MNHRLLGFGLASVVTLVPAALGQPADSVEALRQENAALKQRLERLESDLKEIQQRLGVSTAPVTPATAGPAAGPAATLSAAEVARLKQLAAPGDPPVHAGLDIKLYGYVKLDASRDDSRTAVGNFARWTESEVSDEHDDQFSMTANQTRLGADLSVPLVEGLKTTGRVEIDFYGSGTGENKPEPLLRHAYLNAEWPELGFSVLAGQTSDVISPLFLPTVNYTVGWWQGNIGYRRPQLRLTKTVALDPQWGLKVELAATRTITGRRFLFTAATDPDSGDDSGFPTFQGRTSVTFPLGGKRQGALGFSGHWGQEDQHVTGPLDHHDIDTWSANVDLRLVVADWLVLQGEAVVGQNLDSYLGGIGQGINPTTYEPVNSYGLWGAASLGPWGRWTANVGGALDDPDDGDLTAASARTFNTVVFGNLQYAFSRHFQLAFEQSYLWTDYRGAPSGDDIRQQLAAILKF